MKRKDYAQYQRCFSGRVEESISWACTIRMENEKRSLSIHSVYHFQSGQRRAQMVTMAHASQIHLKYKSSNINFDVSGLLGHKTKGEPSSESSRMVKIASCLYSVGRPRVYASVDQSKEVLHAANTGADKRSRSRSWSFKT